MLGHGVAQSNPQLGKQMNEVHYHNTDLGIAGIVIKQKSGKYAVFLEDLDAGQRFPVASTNLTFEQAITKAKHIANIEE